MPILSRLTLLFGTAVLLSACGGDEGGQRDTVGPSVSVTTPADGAQVTTADVTVTGTASDDTGVASVVVNGIPAVGTTSWSVQVPLAVGSNELFVAATDTLGNTNLSAAQLTVVRVDVTPPVASITSPGDGTTTYADRVTVAGTASDDVALAGVQVDGADATGTTDWSIEVPLAVGVNTISVFARDLAGNVQTVPATVTITRLADDEVPSVAYRFPPSDATTSGATLTLTGVASDDNSIVALEVNGTPVESSDGFATWRISLPLQTGSNELLVAATDVAGKTSTARRVVTRAEQPLQSPTDVVVDAEADRVLVIDSSADAVFAVSRADGARTLVSGPALGSGPRLVQPLAGTIRPGERALYLVDSGLNAVVRVDLATGDRSIVSDAGRGSGTALRVPVSIAYESVSDVFIVGTTAAGVVRVDRSSGDRIHFGTQAVSKLTEDPTRSRVLGATGARVFAIDPATQTVTTLSGQFGPGTGPVIGLVADIALSPGGDHALILARYVLDPPGSGLSADYAILAVDLDTGDRTLVPYSGGAADRTFLLPDSMAFDASADRLYFTDFDAAGVLSAPISPARVLGDRGLTSGSAASAAGSGPAVQRGVYMSFDQVGARAFVSDPATDEIFRIDAATGARLRVGGAGFGTGQPASVSALGYLPTLGALLVYDARGRYLRVDVTTGAGTVVSSFDPADPDAFMVLPSDLAFDASTGRVLAASSDDVVFAMDPLAGDSIQLASDTDGGTGIALDDIRAVQRLTATEVVALHEAPGVGSLLTAIDTGTKARRVLWSAAPAHAGGDTAPLGLALLSSDTAFVGDWHDGSITRIDLVTGAAVEVSGPARGTGPTSAWEDIALDASGQVVFAIDRHGLYAIDVTSGDRVIISR